MPSLPIIVADAFVCFLIGAAIGTGRGRGGDGALLGLILGPLGLLIALTLKPTVEVAAARAEAIEAERAKLRAAAEAGAGQEPPAAS